MWPLLLLACAPTRDCGFDLWYVDDGQAAAVQVVGDWNDWTPEPLEPVTEGAWNLVLDLSPGEHEYLLDVDGERVIDPLQPLLSWDGEQERSVVRIADCAEPALRVDELQAEGDGALRLRATFERARGGERLEGAEATLEDGTPIEVELDPSAGELRASADGLPSGKHTITLTAWPREGAPPDPVRLPLWIEDEPFSWEGTLVYQVVLDRFATASGPVDPDATDIGGRMGGDLPGLLRVLESGWFDQLGVGALWISPVNNNPEGRWEGRDGHAVEAYHGYWPVSPDTIEPALGTKDDLRALVSAAHARGLRVILDVVPNHTHQDHPYYTAHPEWFHDDPDCICGDYDCPWGEDIETCWFTDYLPDLAWESPDAAATMVADTVAWATRFDLDGFRVDAVPMMPRAATRALVAALGQTMEQGGTRFYTVGETFTGADGQDDIRWNLGPFGLDGQFDFPVMWALRDYATGADADALAQAIADSAAAWEGSGSVMAPFVGNHDLPRLLSVADGQPTDDPWGAPPTTPTTAAPYQDLVLAQAIALTLPGAPVLYYGDEIGLSGANDPDCRRAMRFDGLDAHESWTLDRTRRLGQARACSTALRHGALVPLLAQGPLYAHLRDAGDGFPAITVVNASDQDRVAEITLPAGVRVPDDAAFIDIVEGTSQPRLRPGQPIRLSIPARAARVYLPQGLACLPELP